MRRRIRDGAELMVPGVQTILRRAVERGELDEQPHADAVSQMLLGIALFRVVAVDRDPAPVISAFETLLRSRTSGLAPLAVTGHDRGHGRQGSPVQIVSVARCCRPGTPEPGRDCGSRRCPHQIGTL